MTSVLGALVALVALSLGGCTSCDEPRRSGGADAKAQASAASDTTRQTDAAALPMLREDGVTYAPLTFAFDVPTLDVWIEDAKMGAALDEILAQTGATLAVNGGFFDTNERALGLTVSRGAALSPFSRTMSGGVLAISDGRASVTATEDYDLDAAAKMPDFAVQCRPRLVVQGKVNIKRDDGKRSARTALCVLGGGAKLVSVIVRDASDPSYGPSLFALAGFLKELGCESALNLDGGPSTGVAYRDARGTHVERPVSGIRHAIVFRPRP